MDNEIKNYHRTCIKKQTFPILIIVQFVNVMAYPFTLKRNSVGSNKIVDD